MKSINPLRISIVQAPLEWTEKEKNLEYFSREMEILSGQTDLVVLPEMFATGFVTDSRQIVDPMNGMVMLWMTEQARKLSCVVTGSIAIIEKNKIYNRLVWMRPDGSYETTDKRHLFRMANEHQHYTQGNNKLIVELKGWKIRPLVCYDLRFPVWSMNGYNNANYDYDVLIYVANWPASRSYIWKNLLIARAIENQAYCVGVNRIGKDGNGIPYSGNSMVLDFKGRPLLTAPANKPTVDTVTFDYGKQGTFRERFTVGLDWDKFNIVGL
ncbi:MAG: amidohydrolase [Lentimicrobium sp.]|jgi:predicted amidohydrolase|nr:amidohydrolase [Lentimicrobium sp.]